MKEKLEKIKAEAIRQINESEALEKLNEVRVNFLGKKGELTAVLKGMKEVAPEDRPKIGQLVNEAREEIERVLDGKSAADIEAVELRADGLELAVDVHTLGQLVPIISRILDARIDEEMEHLELELLVLVNLGLVEVYDVVVADTQARGVEVEFGLLLAGDADADLALGGEGPVEEVDLLLVVDYRNRVLEAVLEQLGDILHVLRTLEAVADDVAVLVDHAAVVEGVDDVDVVGRRGFEMDVVLERLLQHEREMARFGAVAVVVHPLVVDLGHRHVEHALGPVDLLGDLRQVGDLERRAVLLDELHQRNVVELQLPLLHRELVLGKIEGLFDQIDVLVFHVRSCAVSVIRLVCIAIFGPK